jgi:hypothetical protein
MTIPSDSVFSFFVAVWWASVTFHMAMYFPIWLTKAGRWSEMWLGDGL